MTKLEEVARAICCPEGCTGDTGSGAPCNISAEDRTAMAQARAALAAIREPSEEMAIAGAESICEFDAEGHNDAPLYIDFDDNAQALYRREASEAFVAMIDAALTEERAGE